MALKISASQREVLEAFVRTSNWNGCASLPDPAFMYHLGVSKLTDQVLADFYVEIVEPNHRGDLKAGYTVRIYRDGCAVHLAWQTPKGERWSKAWFYDLAAFAADVA